MNARECAVLQKLVRVLDDTRLLYAKLEPLLIHPHLKYLAAQIMQSHDAIADDLAWHMDAMGGLAARRGGDVLTALRASVESWVAITRVDVEFDCLNRIARHEARVTQHFRIALGEVEGLSHSLYRELCQLERAGFQVESLMQEMEMPPFYSSRR